MIFYTRVESTVVSKTIYIKYTTSHSIPPCPQHPHMRTCTHMMVVVVVMVMMVMMMMMMIPITVRRRNDAFVVTAIVHIVLVIEKRREWGRGGLGWGGVRWGGRQEKSQG